MDEFPAYRQPWWIERVLDRIRILLIDRGLASRHHYVLEVRGRRSGLPRRTPVLLFGIDDVLYLVSPRGETHWARNLRASRELKLRRGKEELSFHALEIGAAEKRFVLHNYLHHFGNTVERLFLIDRGGDPDMFWASAWLHPTFRLLPATPPPRLSDAWRQRRDSRAAVADA